MMNKNNHTAQKPISIYIHIPFCVQKCSYCDFLSSAWGEDVRQNYLSALSHEINHEAASYHDYEVNTIFIGGGTPSLLPAAQIERLLDNLRERFRIAPAAPPGTSPEITVEVNPGTATAEKLAAYRRAGINRLSIGMQSANDHELKILGRIHNHDESIRTFHHARNAGFNNINIDLMSALPGQSPASYQNTLEQITALGPEHLSVYSLILEEGTPLHDCYHDNHRNKKQSKAGDLPPLPSEDEEAALDLLTASFLNRGGYHRYEISNYAQKGYECRHNLVYWQRGDYIGLGLGAASMVANKRWHNTKSMTSYLSIPNNLSNSNNLTGNTIKENIQNLSIAEQMEEFMFLGLRLTDGVSKNAFYRCFHQSIESIYGPTLTKLEQAKLLQTTPDIRLTPYGMDISNYVLSHFLLDSQPL